jgi:hypothetical protein
VSLPRANPRGLGSTGPCSSATSPLGLWLVPLAFASWPLSVIGALYVVAGSMFFAAVYAREVRTVTAAVAWVIPWLVAVSLWTLIVAGTEVEKSIGDCFMMTLVGLCIGTLTYPDMASAGALSVSGDGWGAQPQDGRPALRTGRVAQSRDWLCQVISQVVLSPCCWVQKVRQLVDSGCGTLAPRSPAVLGSPSET